MISSPVLASPPPPFWFTPSPLTGSTLDQFHPVFFDQAIKVEIVPYDEQHLEGVYYRYTLDSTAPTARSARYNSPINIAANTQLTVYSYDARTDQQLDYNGASFYFTNEIWHPTPRTSWQWQLSGTIDTSLNVAMYDIDLFDTPTSTIQAIQKKGSRVICYFSAGSYEQWREDAGQFPDESLGQTLDGWPGERWLDIRDFRVKQMMLSRLNLAVSKGCDGVEPDNVDAYQNDSGFNLTTSDQLQYNIWLAEKAHERGLSIGLKNDLDQVEELEPYFDWALNEECFAYNECDQLKPFIDHNKAVFGVEYVGNTTDFCPKATALNFSWLKKSLSLDAQQTNCAYKAVTPSTPPKPEPQPITSVMPAIILLLLED